MITPRYLSYDSLEAWAEGESLPADWMKHPDLAQRSLWWKQFEDLKQHLWSRHVATLAGEEQREFKAGTHPSLSHRFQEQAQPFTRQLQAELARLGYKANVKLGLYHGDRIVLSATLDRTPPRRAHDVPWFFRGLEVKYGFPASN